MRRLKVFMGLSIVLGVLSLFAGVATHLALTDIYHGETDVTVEWAIVRVCALVFLTFIVIALVTLIRALKTIRLSTP